MHSIFQAAVYWVTLQTIHMNSPCISFHQTERLRYSCNQYRGCFCPSTRVFRISSGMIVREVKGLYPDTDTVITTRGRWYTKTHFMDIYDLLETLPNIIRMGIIIQRKPFLLEEQPISLHRRRNRQIELIVFAQIFFGGFVLHHSPDHIIISS